MLGDACEVALVLSGFAAPPIFWPRPPPICAGFGAMGAAGLGAGAAAGITGLEATPGRGGGGESFGAETGADAVGGLGAGATAAGGFGVAAGGAAGRGAGAGVFAETPPIVAGRGAGTEGLPAGGRPEGRFGFGAPGAFGAVAIDPLSILNPTR